MDIQKQLKAKLVRALEDDIFFLKAHYVPYGRGEVDETTQNIIRGVERALRIVKFARFIKDTTHD